MLRLLLLRERRLVGKGAAAELARESAAAAATERLVEVNLGDSGAHVATPRLHHIFPVVARKPAERRVDAIRSRCAAKGITCRNSS